MCCRVRGKWGRMTIVTEMKILVKKILLVRATVVM